MAIGTALKFSFFEILPFDWEFAILEDMVKGSVSHLVSDLLRSSNECDTNYRHGLGESFVLVSFMRGSIFQKLLNLKNISRTNIGGSLNADLGKPSNWVLNCF